MKKNIRKKSVLTKNYKPEKRLMTILPKFSGRDNTGQVSVRHKGGRQKRYYRAIDFKRDKRDIEGKVISIEYDPNRNAHIALIEYPDEKRYILCPEKLKVGDKVVAGEKVRIKVGNALPIKRIPIGIEIHNLEIYPGQGGKTIRGAGTYGLIVAKEEKYAHVKFPSKEIKKVLLDCYATIGKVGNPEHKYEKIGKAGRKRLMGIRPTVRGTAQNPRSHPHGGGEGRSGEGRHPKTPWGKPAKGKKTRNKKKSTSKLIVKPRK